MQELHNNLLKYFKFSLSVHVGILWQSQNIPDSVYEISQKIKKKRKKLSKANWRIFLQKATLLHC